MTYAPYYPAGWSDAPSSLTPIVAAALNTIEAGVAAAPGIATAASSPRLTQVSAKTANYTASANQIVPVDTTSGSITVTLPTAPAAGTLVSVKQVTRGGTNTVSVAGGGSDVFNTASGSTSLLLTLTSQGALLQYASGIWVVLSEDLPLSQLDARYVAQAETKAFVAVGSSQVAFSLAPTGTGDAQGLGNYQDLFQDRNYGASGGINEVVWMSGYNPGLASGIPACYTTIHPDAGDTNVSGAHGVEWLLTYATPQRTQVINAIELVGVADETGSCSLTFRCGLGSDAGYSQINFQTSDASTNFMQMSGGAVTVQVPTFYLQPATGAPNLIVVAPTGSSATMQLRGASGQQARIYFQVGTVVEWSEYASGSTLAFYDYVNNRVHATWTQGATAAAALSEFGSKVRVDSSLIVGTVALATTATDGFLYLPSVPGAPTGVPTVQTGTAAAVFDTTNSKIWVYNGSWKGVVVS